MALFLNEDEVGQVLDMPLALEAVEAAHRELAGGKAVDVPRQRSRLPQTALHILQGALPSANVIGYKAYTSNRSGVRFFVHLFAADTGVPLAVLAADRLGMMRTAAASGVAARWLARPDSEVAGVFGAGWQAEGHIEAICAVLPLRRVKVHARDRERLEAFCTRLEARVAAEVVPVATPEAVVRGSDLVGTVTTASQPLFDAAWLGAGTHLNAAGSNALIRQELSEAVVRRADLVVVDSVDTAVREAGDLLPLLEKGRLQARELVELGDLLIGRRLGRRGAGDITLFESQGLAVQDLALAVRVLERARARGLGTPLPYGGAI